MTTVGDLFVRVTAKDANFQRSMRNVQGSISRVSNSVSRMAGVFGVAFGMGALVSKTIESAAKYSAVFSKEMALANRDAQLFWIAAGQGIGPAFAEITKEIRAAFGTTEQWRDTFAELGDYALAFVDLMKIGTITLRANFKILKEIGKFFGGIIGQPLPFSPNNPYTQSTNQAELRQMQTEAAGSSQANKAFFTTVEKNLQTIANNTQSQGFS